MQHGDQINLQGMAIGNGCWGSGENVYCGFGKEQKRLEAEFLYGHGFFSPRMKQQLDAACSWTPGETSPISEACARVLAEVGARSPHRQGDGPTNVGTSEYGTSTTGISTLDCMHCNHQLVRCKYALIIL